MVVQACDLSSWRLRLKYCEASSGKEEGECSGQVLQKESTRSVAFSVPYLATTWTNKWLCWTRAEAEPGKGL